ncbi:MAG TPA: dihydroorotase [Candidatus Scubalenecus merdavium]|uniref:Dihydroorotase n=1 Tax=Candidatus Scybalenecus merdavium TaxID=2840939 RepID=A0A9D1SNN5_9FIRM|nr:dihydroorotase [Candidatus Scubalenecus merdavium]
MTILLKDALVYSGAGFELRSVLIHDFVIGGLSVSFSDLNVQAINARVIDCKSKLLLLPGFADVHVHLREPGFSYKETIKTGTEAAAAAGYTLLCTMPNVNPVPDCPENLKVQTDMIERDAVIDVLPFASITKNRRGRGELVDFAALAPMVAGFSDDGTGIQTGDLMEEAMRRCVKTGKLISAHCEDESLLHGGYIHDGAYCRAHGHKGICAESEWGQIERDLALAEKTGCRYHVCHISTKESVQLIREAKKRGVPVTCETAPHYLVLCEDDLQEDGRFKMNPPLRSAADKQALIEGVQDGTIDVIATDHAPHSAEEKARGLKGSAMGVVGLETAFPVLYTKLVKTGVISLERLVQMMSVRPREIFGLAGGKIEPGAPADLCLIDPERVFTVEPDKFKSKGRATPFAGMQLQGVNLLTLRRGEIVYEAL